MTDSKAATDFTSVVTFALTFAETGEVNRLAAYSLALADKSLPEEEEFNLSTEAFAQYALDNSDFSARIIASINEDLLKKGKKAHSLYGGQVTIIDAQ